MFRQFKFEEPLYQRLEQMPLSTQFKMEMLGLQLPLSAWNQLAPEERWVLCHMPIRSRGERECYGAYLAYLLRRQKVPTPPEAAPSSGKNPWEDLSRLPPEVAQKGRELNLPLYWPDWIKLDDMERYIVYKLCREKAADSQIHQAVQELLGSSSLPSVKS